VCVWLRDRLCVCVCVCLARSCVVLRSWWSSECVCVCVRVCVRVCWYGGSVAGHMCFSVCYALSHRSAIYSEWFSWPHSVINGNSVFVLLVMSLLIEAVAKRARLSKCEGLEQSSQEDAEGEVQKLLCARARPKPGITVDRPRCVVLGAGKPHPRLGRAGLLGG
jgi:hypothetical protein